MMLSDWVFRRNCRRLITTVPTKEFLKLYSAPQILEIKYHIFFSGKTFVPRMPAEGGKDFIKVLQQPFKGHLRKGVPAGATIPPPLPSPPPPQKKKLIFREKIIKQNYDRSRKRLSRQSDIEKNFEKTRFPFFLTHWLSSATGLISFSQDIVLFR